jgi:ankyrin repeat protein
MMRCDDALEFLLAKCVAPSAAFASSSFTTVESPSTPTSGSARNVMVDLADRSGRTSLHYAALLGHAPAILLLLRAGMLFVFSPVPLV